MHPSVNTLERFLLHQEWFIAKKPKKMSRTMRKIESKLDEHDLHPETFTASPSELLSELMDVEKLTISTSILSLTQSLITH